MKKIHKIKNILSLLIVLVSYVSFAQINTQEVTIEFKNISIKDALLKLENQTDYTFFYQENWFKKSIINQSFSNESINNILLNLLKETPLNYTILDKKIILTKNSIILNELPIHYFSIKEKEKYEDKSIPINIKNYVENDSQNSIITVGKENTNSKQNIFEISGYIKSFSSMQPLKDVKVYIPQTEYFTKTNNKGFYRLKVPSGFNAITVELSGFETGNYNLIAYGNGRVNFDMYDDVVALGEVVITSDNNENTRKAVVGMTKVDVKKAKIIPMVLGERDLLKIATTMPGVKTAGEGSLGYNVRGGKSDQNLILLDHAVLYNPSHFFGVFSAINPFSTGNVEVYKGSIPAEFGGRLSSVIDISTKSVNKDKFSGQGNIGPVTANLSLETPIVKDKTAILTSFRTTYSDWILKQIQKKEIRNSEASFYDAIVRFDSQFLQKHTLKGTAYYSKDQFSISSDSVYKYNNRLASLEWKYKFSKNHRSSLQINDSRYDFNIIYDGVYNRNFNLNYAINETQAKFKIHSSLNKHKLNYGLSTKLYNISPGEINPLGENSIVQQVKIDKERAVESAVFISDKYEITDKLLLNFGLRYSTYSFLGETDQNIYATDSPVDSENIIETIHYKKNEVVKTYSNPEIRASFRYFLTSNLSVKGGYNKTTQYVHMLTNNTTASPVDTWKLSNLNIKPQYSQQFSVGFFQNFQDNDYELSLESYYKETKNNLDFKVGAEILLSNSIEEQLLNGKGRAYGLEFLLEKKTGDFNGWISYSYSRSFLKLESDFIVDQINRGNYFPSNFDKPHDLSVIANYKLTKRYSFSLNFVYQTGRPITYPIGNYYLGGIEHVLYSDRNQFRIPDYYRFDIGVNIEGNHKIKKLAHSFWNISVYNVLGRNNPYSIFFINENGRIKAYKTSIFAVPIPTITYNFKF